MKDLLSIESKEGEGGCLYGVLAIVSHLGQ